MGEDSLSNGDQSGGDRDEKGRFQPGHSLAGPGRPRRYIANTLRKAVSEADMTEVLSLMLEQAHDGCRTSQKYLAERYLGRVREEPGDDFVSLGLPPIKTGADCVAAATHVLEAVASGEISIGDATALLGMIETTRKSVETAVLEARVAALEESGGQAPDSGGDPTYRRYA